MPSSLTVLGAVVGVAFLQPFYLFIRLHFLAFQALGMACARHRSKGVLGWAWSVLR